MRGRQLNMQENLPKVAQSFRSPEDPHWRASLPLPRERMPLHLQSDLKSEEAPRHPQGRKYPSLQGLRRVIQQARHY